MAGGESFASVRVREFLMHSQVVRKAGNTVAGGAKYVDHWMYRGGALCHAYSHK